MTAMTAKAGSNWKAQWIGLEGDSRPNTWYCFRKVVQLDKTPQSAIARIACDSKYWLWVNGQLAVFEGQLKRGPTPQDTYYDEVDLSPYLRKGHNTLAVLVWYWGKHGFSHNSSGRAGLLFQADINRKILVSDIAWKVRLHPAYGATEEPHPNFRLSEANIHFDARLDMAGWQEPDFDDSAWQAAAEFGKPPVSPWNRLEKRPILQWKNIGLTYYESVEEKVNTDGTRLVIGKLPYNCHVTPYLKVKAPAGCKIDIRTDNYLGGGKPNVRAEYITRDGIQEFESLGWMNGHDMRYTMPQNVEVIAVQYRQTGYNADFAGRFKCSDEKLNILWEKSRRTLYVTMRDTYMDCPDRERAQWWGDMVNEMGEAFYVFDVRKGPLLAKKGIYELARWQRKDKVLYSPVPAGVPGPDNLDRKVNDGTWNKELPCQMLASVGWYGFWTYYWYTGDKQTIVDVYPHVRDYLSLWKLGNDGLCIHRQGDWDWMDWGDNKDVPVLENAWLYLAMKGAVEMARLSGNRADIPGYRATMDSIKDNFNKTFWQGDKYRSPGCEGQTDDRANAMAVVAGLADPATYPAIREVLKTQYYASPYMEKYVLESLYLMDAPQEAIARMKERWAEQLDSPISTLLEGWGIGKKGYGGGTYNHAWSGGPLTVLSQYGAGVAPTQPGFRKFAVLPQMADLKEIEAVVPTRYGDIQLKIQKAPSFKMELFVPADTVAEVGIPKNVNPSMIQINGKTVYRYGKASSDSYLGEDMQWIRYSVKEGQWTFEAK
ncbi:MAG: glycoside hydrolase [Planctomycetes bacterium]|nr:glycoside hydrolase [Planctomycetota bacterium]